MLDIGTKTLKILNCLLLLKAALVPFKEDLIRKK